MASLSQEAQSEEIDDEQLLAQAAELQQRGQLEKALPFYSELIKHNPRHPRVFNNLGVASKSRGRFDLAVALYQRHLSLNPKDGGAYSNLGNAYRAMGKLEKALEAHQKAVRLLPENAHYRYNMALVLKDLGQLEQALEAFEFALGKDPYRVNFHWDYALCLLQLGRYEEGWREYEWRWKLDEAVRRDFSSPPWEGQPLDDQTLLVYCEQGFGDSIHFARYLNLVRPLAEKLLLETHPLLTSLFEASFPELDQVIPRGNPLPPHDYHVPLLSLPYLMGTRFETIPKTVPYIKTPQGKDNPARALIRSTAPSIKLKVGIAWAGKPSQKNDPNRSCPLHYFLRLLEIPDIALFSLQKGERERDLAALGADFMIPNLGPYLEDFTDSAVLLDELDLLISVDTAPLHLAGAMGRPAWGILCFAACWRYFHDRSDSPWYPTQRLFRQQSPGDWESVFDQVIPALKNMM